MSGYIPATLRRLIAERAHGLCEYCLIHEEDTFFGCQIEHIIAEKHGGPTTADNLAYACIFCNRYKGSDIATLSRTGQLVRLYNPRSDDWSAHFEFAPDGITIRGIDDIGDVTIRLLEFNHADRILERQTLHAVGRYPTPAALEKMRRMR
jgi:HNH endonuclease